jgi:hypothetical protein
MLVAILESIAACASHGASPVVAGRAFSLRVVREGVRVHTFAKSPTSVLAGGEKQNSMQQLYCTLGSKEITA